MNKKRAIIIGGTGQAGYAIATALIDQNWHNELFPQLAAYPYNHFDYEEEDRYFSFKFAQ